MYTVFQMWSNKSIVSVRFSKHTDGRTDVLQCLMFSSYMVRALKYFVTYNDVQYRIEVEIS